MILFSQNMRYVIKTFIFLACIFDLKIVLTAGEEGVCGNAEITQEVNKLLKETDMQVGYNEAAKVVEGRVFPLTLEPQAGKKVAFDGPKNKDVVIELAKEHGAVLLRGFDVNKAEDFADIVHSLKLENMPYVGGAAVRRNIVGETVFTANESPPSEPIPFHHEMAQVANPPRYVMFYCEIAPESGGETPLILSNQVYKFLKKNYPETCSKLETLGVKYVRTMPSEDDENSAIGRSWKNTFVVENKSQAEAKMRSMGHSWDWLSNGDLKTVTGVLPAIRSIPNSKGKKTFFNSVVAAFKGWVDSRNDPLKAVLYGDNTPIDTDALEGIFQFMEREKVATPWHVGDVIIVDNAVAMHSRNTYESKRRVLASVGRSPLSGTAISSRGIQARSKNIDVTKRLYSGDYLPRLGLGFWKVPKDITSQIVIDAIRSGIRHLDCAADYGNEKEVGKGIKKAIELGLVKRSDLFITGKLWNSYHGPHVEAALDKTLSDLQLDYIDLWMIHFPFATKFVPFEKRYPPEWFFDPESDSPKVEFERIPIHVTWKNMEKMVINGKARNIGVCNMGTSQLRDIFTYAKFPPSVLQIEIHPENTQEKLVRFAQENDMQVVAFSPMGPGSYVEINMSNKNEGPLYNDKVKLIAKSKGVTAHQILLRFALQRGINAVFKSSNPNNIKSNLEAFTFELSDDEMKIISNLNLNKRYNDPGVFAEKGFNTFAPIYE